MNWIKAYAADINWSAVPHDIVRIFNFDQKSEQIAEQKLNNPDAIFDYLWYLVHIWKHKRKHAFSKMTEKLNEIKSKVVLKYSNSVDPIEYLAYLYFICEYSTDDISKKLSDIWIIIPKRTIVQMFSVTFNWELRHKNDRTAISHRKNKAKLRVLNAEKKEKIDTQTRSFVNQVLNNNIPDFSREELKYYEFCKNIIEKIVFLVSKFNLWYDKDSIWKYFIFLESIGQSQRTIAKNIQSLFDEFYKKYFPEASVPTIKSDYIAEIIKSVK